MSTGTYGKIYNNDHTAKALETEISQVTAKFPEDKLQTASQNLYIR
jgi:hypothetical protein